MLMKTAHDAAAEAPQDLPGHSIYDPLDADLPCDPPLALSARALMRVALIASETASRFEREGVAVDPMAWMMAPRRMFDGMSALDACRDREACLRALLLHGLSLGLDADPQALDALGEDDDNDCLDDDEAEDDGAIVEGQDGTAGDGDGAKGVGDVVVASCGRSELYTGTGVREQSGVIVHFFDAVIARSEAEAVAMMIDRHGPDAAEVTLGFRRDLPLVEALVSPAVADMLDQVQVDPASPLARGLRISIEQRFAD